jgi:hypothetical protein
MWEDVNASPIRRRSVGSISRRRRAGRELRNLSTRPQYDLDHTVFLVAKLLVHRDAQHMIALAEHVTTVGLPGMLPPSLVEDRIGAPRGRTSRQVASYSHPIAGGVFGP